jgi:hypothetical protein
MRHIVLTIAACLLLSGCEGPKADLTAVELHTAYRDVSKADEQYKGKTIAVSGIVKWVGDTMVQSAGSLSVYLGAPDPGEEVMVMCQFLPASAGQAQGLRTGEYVVIRGLCRGDCLRDGAPYLSKCVVVR